ncbi:MAG TPA: hypothetical protein VFI65_31190 [Streptosporangiaceae bacterium]|nr:hypothetical protein [Streptosporangiaceae bacterium]
MRIVEWSGRPVGEPGTKGSQSRMGQRSDGFGPMSDAEAEHHHFGSLLDPLAARQARQRAHAEDLAHAGTAGEVKGAVKLGGRHFATDLEGRLGDDWLLIHGLATTSGSISQLLLGPAGLVALTSLHLNATVHCRGDKWHAEREVKPGGHPAERGEHHGHHGSSVEVSLDDHQGRSPSVALNQAADTLEKFLRSSGEQMRVERAVLVNHPRPSEDQWHRPTVQVFGSTPDFLSWLHKLPKTLDRGQKREIEKLIMSGESHHRQAVQES